MNFMIQIFFSWISAASIFGQLYNAKAIYFGTKYFLLSSCKIKL